MFQFFKKRKEPENLEEVLKEIRKIRENLDKVSLELEKLKAENKINLQKIGIVRFNPFKEIGGNQSFSVAFLNNKGDGIVISGLHYKEGTRVYVKPIKNGKSEYPLTTEEKIAIERAKYENKNSKSNSKNSSSSNFGPHR